MISLKQLLPCIHSSAEDLLPMQSRILLVLMVNNPLFYSYCLYLSVVTTHEYSCGCTYLLVHESAS
jgi:hypothetical protein